MQLLPYDAQFNLIFRFKNGWIRRHFLVDVNAANYRYIEEIAYEKAQQQMRVDILPTLGNVDDPLRAIIFPDAIFAKSPDLRINGILWEVEQPTKVKLNTVKHSIDEAAAQANKVIINLKYNVDETFMYRVATGRFKDHKNLEVIEFRYHGKYTLYNRG